MNKDFINLFKNINKDVFISIYNVVTKAGFRPVIVCLTTFIESIPFYIDRNEINEINLENDGKRNFEFKENYIDFNFKNDTTLTNIKINYTAIVKLKIYDEDLLIHTYSLQTHNFVNEEMDNTVQLYLKEIDQFQKNQKNKDIIPKQNHLRLVKSS